MRNLVDEGDIDVALRILDGLRRLGGLDGSGTKHAAFGDRAIDFRERCDDFLVLAGDNLRDLVDRMRAVAGVDAFGTIAEAKVAAAREARHPLDFRSADVLRYAGIDGAFIDDCRSQFRIDQLRQCPRCINQRAKIRLICRIDGRRNGHDIDVRAGAFAGLGRYPQLRGFELVLVDLMRAVAEGAKLIDAFPIDVEAYRVEFARKRDGQRQSHISKTNDDNAAFGLHPPNL